MWVSPSAWILVAKGQRWQCSDMSQLLSVLQILYSCGSENGRRSLPQCLPQLRAVVHMLQLNLSEFNVFKGMVSLCLMAGPSLACQFCNVIVHSVAIENVTIAAFEMAEIS